MGDTPEYGPVAAGELEELAAMLAAALRLDPSDFPAWMRDTVGLENWRQLRRDGALVAGLGIHPEGQFFGGRELACAAIACVGIPVRARGQGLSVVLLRETLEELRAAGTPLAGLYASAFPVYRKGGFERAGTYTRYRLALQSPRRPDRSLELEEVRGERLGLARELYAAVAPAQPGNLSRRTEHFWRNALGLRSEPRHHVLVVHEGGAPAGYAVVDHGRQLGPLRCSDLRWRTPAAARRLWVALTDQATMADGLVYAGAPQDAFFHVVDDPRPRIEESLDWMLRLVDVDRALSGRGYPARCEERFELHVEDDFLPANAGPRVLTVAGGQGRVEPGGAGGIRVDVRDLACLFTGFRTAHELATVGSLRAAPEELVRLEAAFAGPRPWMPDRF